MNLTASHLLRRTLALSTLTLAGSLSVSAHAAPTAVVEITAFMFAPKDITVAPGTTVRWTNHDETPHTVTSQGGQKVLASKAMDTDDKFEFNFTSEGDFPYLCSVHPFMTGTVHVRKP